MTSLEIICPTVTASVINLESGLGKLKVLDFVCDKAKADEIIKHAVSKNIPFERTQTGVKIFN